MATAIVVDELDPRDPSPAALDAWRALAAGALDPNPFHDPDVVGPAVRHLAGPARVRLAVARREERWLACVPITVERRWRRLPVPCAVGWSHPYAFLGTPLLAGDAPEEAAQGLRAIAGHGRSRGFLALEACRADGPVAELLRDGSGAVTELYGEQRAALVRRPQDDYVDGHRSGKRRREAARQRRRLATELGGEPLLRPLGRTRDAVEGFLALEASGWKHREGTALASDPEHAAFFRAIATVDSASLRSEILALGTADRPAAMLFNLLAGDTAYSLKLAHDEALQAGAPGVLLMADAAGWFHDATSARHYDSCALPDNPMINALWPDRRALASFVVPGRGAAGLAGRVAVDAFAAARRRRAAARERAADA